LMSSFRISASSRSRRSSWRSTYSPCSSRYSDSLSNAASADSGVNCWVPSNSEYSKRGMDLVYPTARPKWLLRPSERHDRQIVVLLAANEVFLDGGDESFAGGTRRHGAGGGAQHRADAVHLEFLLLLVLGVGDAVGEEEDGIAGIDRDGGGIVGDALGDAERKAG